MKFPTYEEMAEKVAEKALDEFLYKGKSIREWMQIITSEDAISRQAVIDALNKTSGIRGDALKALYDLPLVAPKEKTGHWKPKEDNKQSKCNSCQNNTDELSGECYECVKGIEDWYEPISELKGE